MVPRASPFPSLAFSRKCLAVRNYRVYYARVLSACGSNGFVKTFIRDARFLGALPTLVKPRDNGENTAPTLPPCYPDARNSCKTYRLLHGRETHFSAGSTLKYSTCDTNLSRPALRTASAMATRRRANVKTVALGNRESLFFFFSSSHTVSTLARVIS